MNKWVDTLHQDRATFHRLIVKNNAKKRRMYEAFIECVPLLKSLEVGNTKRHQMQTKMSGGSRFSTFCPSAVREDEDR